MPTPTLDAPVQTDQDTDLLNSLDFEPAFTCEHENHDLTPYSQFHDDDSGIYEVFRHLLPCCGGGKARQMLLCGRFVQDEVRIQCGQCFETFKFSERYTVMDKIK